MLHFVDEALDQVPLFVKVFVVVTLLSPRLRRRNNGLRALVNNVLNEVFGIIGAVADEIVGQLQKAYNQRFRLRDVMTLTGRQQKAQRVSQAIDAHVDFGAKAAATASERLGALVTVFLGAPAAQGCARTTVLSMIRYSMSGSAAKCSSISAQTP